MKDAVEDEEGGEEGERVGGDWLAFYQVCCKPLAQRTTTSTKTRATSSGNRNIETGEGCKNSSNQDFHKVSEITWQMGFVFVVSKFCLWDVVMRYYMYSNGKAATLLIIDATALCIWQGSLMHNSQNLFWVYMHTLEAYLMNLCLKAVSMLCCAWLQASKPPLLKNIFAFPCTTRHSIFGWSEKKAANRWYPFWLAVATSREELDVYHKKTESWKDIDWQSEASCSDNILSYPPFYPLLRLLLLRCYFS